MIKQKANYQLNTCAYNFIATHNKRVEKTYVRVNNTSPWVPTHQDSTKPRHYEVSVVCGNPYSVGIKELKAAERVSNDVLEAAVPREREGRVSNVPGLRFQIPQIKSSQFSHSRSAASHAGGKVHLNSEHYDTADTEMHPFCSH